MEDAGVSHDWNREELWAPFFVGCRYGPSTWAPSKAADLGMSRGAREGSICKGQVHVST